MADAAHNVAAPRGKKLKIALVIGVIVLGQCVIAFLFLPSSGEAKASASNKSGHAPAAASHGHAPSTAHGHAQATAHAAPAPLADAEQLEVDLGSFSMTVFNPHTNACLLVDFHLFGTVAGTPSEGGDDHGGHGGHGGGHPASSDEDAGKLEKLLKQHKHRFREQVIFIVRNAQVADLADPSLGLIKRQILAKTNLLLGEPLLREVIFSDFVVVEQ